MSDLEKKMDLHIDEDRVAFAKFDAAHTRIETRIDSAALDLKLQIARLEAQWKLTRTIVGGVVGAVVALLGAWLF